MFHTNQACAGKACVVTVLHLLQEGWGYFLIWAMFKRSSVFIAINKSRVGKITIFGHEEGKDFGTWEEEEGFLCAICV